MPPRLRPARYSAPIAIFPATAAETKPAGPPLVGTFSLGYTRYFQSIKGPGDGRDPAELNVAPSLIQAQLTEAWPAFDLTQENIPSIGSRVRQQANDTWTVMGTFNKLAGSHGLKFGLDYRMLNWNERNPDISYGAAGRFLFDYTMTAADPTKATTGGSAMASLLLGYPTTISGSNGSRVRQGTDLSLRNHYLALFLQDDWKIGRKATANLGPRYELETPYTERFDRIAYGFDANAALEVTVGKLIGTLPTDLAGGLTFVNQGGKPGRQGKIDWNNFGPRIGLAHTLNEKTVLRAGHGIFYASAVQNTGNSPTAVDSFGMVTPYVGSSDGNRTIIPGVNLQNPYPQGFNTPTGSTLGIDTLLGDSITVPNENYVLPYTSRTSASTRRCPSRTPRTFSGWPPPGTSRTGTGGPGARTSRRGSTGCSAVGRSAGRPSTKSGPPSSRPRARWATRSPSPIPRRRAAFTTGSATRPTLQGTSPSPGSTRPGQTPPAGPQWVSRLAPLEPHELAYDKPLCASLDGFTLHAATRAGALTDRWFNRRPTKAAAACGGV